MNQKIEVDHENTYLLKKSSCESFFGQDIQDIQDFTQQQQIGAELKKIKKSLSNSPFTTCNQPMEPISDEQDSDLLYPVNPVNPGAPRS